MSDEGLLTGSQMESHLSCHKISGGTHLSSCDVCLHEDNLMCVLESSSKPVQEYGNDKVSDVLESLDGKATKSLVCHDSKSFNQEPGGIEEARQPEPNPRTERTEPKVQECSDDAESRAKATEDQESGGCSSAQFPQHLQDIGKARQPHPESHPSTEQTKSKEEKLPEGDKIVQLKEEIAALRKGHSGKAKSKKKRKLELELEKTKQENSALQEEIQARSEASETYMAWRTQFRTDLDSRDKTLSNLNEKLEALITEKLECEEDYESQIRLLKSSLEEKVDKNVKLEAEVAELTTRLATVGAEFATKMLSSSHNSKTGTFKNHKQERLKAAKAEKEFLGKNKNKIKDEIEEREDKPNYILTYFDRSQKKHMYKLFAGEQEALTWALRNKDRMKKSYPFIRIQTMEEVDELTTTDLMDVKIELLDPSTGKVLCERMGMFDIGADIASFPYDPEIFKQLMNSVKKINDELVPIVYAKLRIDGEELEKIYPIEVERDKDWCNFGIPQMQDSSETTKRRILQRIGQSFGVAVA